MILLDTNVLSELMRSAPSVAVDAWLSGQPVAGTFISAITEAELRYGLALLPKGQRQRRLLAQAEAMLAEDFAGRILPFDSPAAVAYARIAADRRSAGRPISQADAQIAAIAVSRGATVATRNVADFEGCGIALIDPWSVGGVIQPGNRNSPQPASKIEFDRDYGECATRKVGRR